MKKITLTALLFFNVVCFTQNDTFLWPIKGKEKGENVLYKPQDYIGKEFNFADLIIYAPEGTIVVAPIDGEIITYNYTYSHSLQYMKVYGSRPVDYQKDSAAFIQKDWNNDDDIKFLSVILELKTQNEKTIYISGLRPIKSFKTGEKIKQGDPIGKVGYFYKAIARPAIAISISEKGKPNDPMSPFGLKTTFKKNEQEDKLKLSAEEAKFDLTLFADALREGFPGLYDYISEKEFESHLSQALTSIQTAIKISDFYNIVENFLCKIRDNHLTILSCFLADRTTAYFQPAIFVGWLNDSLIVTRTISDHQKYHKKQVTAVDGIPANLFKKKILSYIESIEGNVESHQDFILATTALLKYFKNCPEASPKRDVSLTFGNGQTVSFAGYEWMPGTCVPILPGFRDFFKINNLEKISMKKFSNETAYLGISTFELNEVEMDQATNFIKSLVDSNYQHLIIDVRNNRGGTEDVEAKIFSYIAQQPFRTSTYLQVNKKGGFDFFEYSTNYAKEQDDLFPEYSPVEGKKGYYFYNTNNILPNETVNFKGDIYVLTNERSLSASAHFAALVHKYRRGVIVGRETGSTYHQMKALKFAHLRLPNSQININIPLVKIVFDTCSNAIPFGRGVLPDYELPLSLEELSSENGDAILNYVQQLIRDGDYLKESVQTEILEIAKTASKNRSIYLIITVICIVFAVYVVHCKNKRKIK